VGNGGGSEVLHPEKKMRGEAGSKMWAKRAPAQSSLRGGEEVVAPVISGDSGDTSVTGVDGRLRESEGGGGGLARWRRRWRGRRKKERGAGRGGTTFLYRCAEVGDRSAGWHHMAGKGRGWASATMEGGGGGIKLKFQILLNSNDFNLFQTLTALKMSFPGSKNLKQNMILKMSIR
jgi:hypothetical protein